MNDPFLASDYRARAAESYARAAAIHERSAQVLRASGHLAAAERVDRFAAVARDRIVHSPQRAQMHVLVRRFRDSMRLSDLFDAALDGAIAFLAADRGNIQLVNPHTRTLRIVSQRGFAADFLDHFAAVGDQQTACGRAARARRQAVIVDVETDAGFAAHRAMASAAGFRAVQSTPMIDSGGRLRGVLSTHFERPHHPSAHELRMTETYARLVADAITDRVAPA